MSVTIRNTFGVVLSCLLIIGCASGERRESALEEVTRSREALDDTGEKLSNAEKELRNVNGTLSELQKQFEKAGDPFSREQAGNALGRLSLQVEQARLDLRQMRNQNRERAAALDARLKGVSKASALQSLEPLPSGSETTPAE